MSPSHPQNPLDADILGLWIAIVHCSQHYCSLLVLHFHTRVCFSRRWLKLCSNMLTFICQQVRLFWKKIKLLKFSKSLIQAQIVSAWPWIWEGIFRSGNKIREWNPSILQRIRETWREIFYFIGSFIFRWGTSTHLWLNALWLTALNGNWLRWMPLRRNTTQALHRDRSDQTCSIILRLVLFPSPLSPEGKPVREKWGIKQRNLSRLIEQMRQNSFFFFRWGE